MEYSNSHYFGLKKRVVSILHHVALFAMLHSSFVAPAQGIIEAFIHGKKPIKYSGSASAFATGNSETEQSLIQSQQGYPAYGKTTSQSYNMANNSMATSYSASADIAEGIIGISKEKPLDNPSDNLFKVNLEQLPGGTDKVYLTYEVFGVADHQSVARSINDRLSVGGHLVKKQAGWSQQKEEINPLWLHAGQNTVLFTIADGADYQYKIKNLSINIEKSDKANALLVLNNSVLTFTKKNDIYIKGFIRGNHPEGKVEAGNTVLQLSNNEFEGYVTLSDEIKRNGFLMIKATDGNLLLGQEIIFINNSIEADIIFPIEKKEEAVSKVFKSGTTSRLDIQGASIVATDSALIKDYNVSISRLRNIDVAPMESGMINVTKGGRGYRFLPDGTKFEKPVNISIAYDSKLIPTGYTEKDIKTYYFDTSSKRWIAVHKDSIDIKNSSIVSKTTHFTDYINGIIQAPDSPETSAFTPTMMSGVKAADPSAEMTLINPPSASQKGDANVGYPIKLPSGRRGMQPNLALQYSNEGGNGWLGLGWNLSTPALTIDTKWGVPVFDPGKETEIYALNGEQLMYPDEYLPHRHQDGAGGTLSTIQQDRNASGTKIFYPRKQGSFSKIERLGTSPQTYYWKVTNTDGTIYWYGGKSASDMEQGIGAFLKDSNQRIVYWALFMVEDVYGNNMTYSYNTPMDFNTTSNLYQGRQLYLNKINYTGYGSDKGNYDVEFVNTTSYRPDISINARLGIKQVDFYLLEQIKVSYKNEAIRSYFLNYNIGKFNKSLLASVTERDGKGNEFYKHTFDYYDDIKQADGTDVYFSKEVTETICIDQPESLMDTDKDGVMDSEDKCIHIPGLAEHQGCPYDDYGIGYESLKNPPGDPGDPDCNSYLTNTDFLIQGNMPSFASTSSPLGSSKSKGSGKGTYLGLGMGCKILIKATTFGKQWTKSSDHSESFSAMIDLNGDGLEDIVYKSVSGNIYYQRHDIQKTYENGNLKINHTYSPAEVISGINNFYKANSNTKSGNFQITLRFFYLGGFAGIDKSETQGETNVYFTDANGDGLPDIVKNGTVFFNRIINDKPEFIPDSMGSPNLVITAEPRTVEVPDEYSETELDIPVYDVVKVWEAPYYGTLKITNNIELTNPTQEVTATIETRIKSLSSDLSCLIYGYTLNAVQPKVEETITSGMVANCMSDNGKINVIPGQLIFFRVHASSTSTNPVVNWDPKVEYTSTPIDPAQTIDQNNLHPYSYKYSEDFLLAQKNKPVVFPGNGTATVTWDDLHVNVPSDDVIFEVYKSVITTPANGDVENSTSNDQLIYKKLCPAGTNTLLSPLDNDIPGMILNDINIASNGSPGSANTATVFYFKIKADSNVNWKQMDWKPKVISATTESVIGEDGSAEGIVTTNQTLHGIPEITIFKVYNKEADDYTYTSQNYFHVNNSQNWPINSYGQPLYIMPYLNGLFASGDNGKFDFIVKRNGLVIDKRTITVTNGSVTFNNNTPIYIGTQQNDKIDLGFYADDSELASNATSILNRLYTLPFPHGAPVNVVRIAAGDWTSGSSIFLTDQSVNLYQIPSPKFGPMHRQWGQFSYNPDAVQNATASDFGDLIKFSALTQQPNPEQVEAAVNQLENWGESITEQNIIDFQAQYGELSSKIPFVPMQPSREVTNGILKEKWIGICPENYVSALSYRAAGLNAVGDEYIDPDDYTVQEVVQTGAYGITKYTKGKSRNISAGINPGEGLPSSIPGASASKSLNASNNSLTDYVDLNGDRYPDIASTDWVQYTKGTGGLMNQLPSNSSIDGEGGAQISRSTNGSWGFAASGSFPKGGKNDASCNGQGNNQSRFAGFMGNTSAGISGNFQKGRSETSRMWADVNGDGLSDILEKGPDNMSVRLNLGNNQYQQMQVNASSWGLSEVFNCTSNSFSGGFGINLWNGSLEAGVSVGGGRNNVENILVDINADGLADVVQSDSNGISVRINDGNKFGSPISWSNFNMARESEINMGSFNTGGTLSLPIPLPPLFIKCFKLVAMNRNGQVFSSTTRTKKSISDYNGDGFPDLISEDHHKLRIQYSNIGRTNMLKTVNNPLGGRFTVDYNVITPTYNNPNAKWVMKSVVVEDGYDLVNDGVDTYRKDFEYENGYYDRREREFYGYDKVKTIDYDPEQQGVVMRTAVSEFHNQSYYLNGLNTSSYVMRGDNGNLLFSRSINNYAVKKLTNTGLIDLSAAAVPLTFDTGGSEGRRAAAVLLTSTENYIYELGSTPLVSRVEYTYDDARGRITKYVYKGNVSVAEDDYTSDITYWSHATLDSKYIYNVPKSIIVKDNTGVERRSRSVKNVDFNTGTIKTLTANITATTWATTDMTYDQYGNLSTVTLPPNENGQQFNYYYDYDTDNQKLPVLVKDGFGYVSTTVYDFKLDKVTQSIDITGNQMNYTYDTFGRTLTVQSPKELEAAVPYTISFAYYPKYSELVAAYNCVEEENFMPVAVTSHYDAQHPGNDIQTYTFMDGLARPVQVKKDIDMSDDKKQEEAVSISGKVAYDAYGRAIQQYHPYYEDKACSVNLVINEYASSYVSTTAYDELDRPILSTDPEGNTSAVNYAIDENYSSLKTTTTIQQNGSQSVMSQAMKDVNGRLTAKVDILTGNNAADLWTTFAYNSIGELLSYKDAEGIKTTYAYDMLGRKIERQHADDGKTTYQYDLAGNLTKVQTAFLASNSLLQPQNRYIKYFYDYNRLSKIMYPDMPIGENISNVDYEYGSTGNDTGRLITQVDATGAQHFEYGNMGEIIHNTRMVVGPNIPTRTFETSFTYDSWNRIQDITYPDGEVVSHQYNLGGNLLKITGDMGGTPYDYIQRIDYDYFEQKTYQLYGNGTDMIYNYTPALRRLDTMVARTSGQQNFLDNSYSYDKIGNVISLHNNATPNSNNMMGGNYSHIYTYDNLNRLINAHGDFSGDSSQQNNNNDYTSDYVLDIGYNGTYGISYKKQQHNKNTQQVAQNTYESGYEYNEGTHMIETITDANTQAVTKYTYDVDGNIFSIYDSSTGTLKRMFWDESKRLRVFFDDIQMQHYIYDANGERVLKGTAKPESIYENGMPQSGTMHFDSYTTYPSAYIVVNPDGMFSKHYYAGSQRIVSRMGDSDASIFEKNKRAAATVTTEGAATTFDEEEVRQQQIGDLTQIFAKAELGVPVFSEYQPADEDETDEQEEESAEAGRTAQRGPSAAGLYFYHPDHLGTSTFLTDANGDLYQFFLNLPFGETMAEQHSLTEDYETPYKFNGKELDSETGLYYYGARYYDPRTSIWLSTDPLMEKFPAHNPYVYCYQNPINFIDPTGMAGVEGDGDDWYQNIETGEVKWIDGNGKVEGYKNLTQEGNELQEVVVNGTVSSNSTTNAGVGVIAGSTAAEGIGGIEIALTSTMGSFAALLAVSSLVHSDTRRENKHEFFYRAMSWSEYNSTKGYLHDLKSSGEGPHVRNDLSYIGNADFINKENSKYDVVVQYKLSAENAALIIGTPFIFVPGQGAGGPVFNAARSAGMPYAKYEKGVSYGFPGATATELFNSSIIGTPVLFHTIKK